MLSPNERPGVDAEWPVPFPFQRPWPRATQAGRYAMRKPLTISIFLVFGLCGLGVALWPASCPIEMKLLSMEPATLIDDAGSELYLVTLSVSNTCGVPIRLSKKMTKGQARIADRWIETEGITLPARLGLWRSSEIEILVPKDTEACRLNLCFRYEHETLKYALGIGMSEAPTLRALRCQQIVYWVSPWLFNQIWRRNASPGGFKLSRPRTAVTPAIILLRGAPGADNAFVGRITRQCTG
jgi:hypothetical protein